MATQHPAIKEFKYALHRIFRNPTAILGFTLLTCFIIVAVMSTTRLPAIVTWKYRTWWRRSLDLN